MKSYVASEFKPDETDPNLPRCMVSVPKKVLEYLAFRTWDHSNGMVEFVNFPGGYAGHELHRLTCEFMWEALPGASAVELARATAAMLMHLADLGDWTP